jgi:hypothetical protein
MQTIIGATWAYVTDICASANGDVKALGVSAMASGTRAGGAIPTATGMGNVAETGAATMPTGAGNAMATGGVGSVVDGVSLLHRLMVVAVTMLVWW